MRQTALFADGSYKITDQWKLSAGVRWYTYKSEQDEFSWGYDGPNLTPPATSQITKASDKGFNPRINLSYAPTQDLTTYATVSKGFRPGGANQILPPPNLPPFCQPGALQFGPDAAWNYEIGEKAKLFDNWLTINSDVYYIKWTGVQQVLTLPCGYQYYNNAGDGRSFGPELEVMQLLGKGGSTRSIAEALHLSVKTIETHRAHIKEKLGFQDSEEMVKFAIDWVTQQEG